MPATNLTIAEGLGRYSIGEKIRTLRQGKSLGLVELGKHTGLSAALLSKLERGKLFPTLPTLFRISLVLGVGLEYFFSDQPTRRAVVVLRRNERLSFPEKSDGLQYCFECLDFRPTDRKLSAYVAEFQDVPSEKAKPHQHPGIEFLYLLKGSLTLNIACDEYVLDAEDAIYFDSTLLHSYRRRGSKTCRGLMITVP